ncbi:MAG: hypothetical protein E7013_02925 [Alphaproteobacteria bacterium]|nr:hypothetical protein [Alphaproteobacteria bacterium]
MNKLLLILSLLYVFYSNQTFANCDFCCTDGKELFCKYAKSEDECTGGCGCCEPDKIYEPKSGYLDCCNGTPFKNSADTNACCDTNNGKAVANVQDAPIAGLQYCCPAEQPNAYWYNDSVTCCKGQFKCTTNTESGNKICRCCDGSLYSDSTEYSEGLVDKWPDGSVRCCEGTVYRSGASLSYTCCTPDEGTVGPECCYNGTCYGETCVPHDSYSHSHTPDAAYCMRPEEEDPYGESCCFCACG